MAIICDLYIEVVSIAAILVGCHSDDLFVFCHGHTDLCWSKRTEKIYNDLAFRCHSLRLRPVSRVICDTVHSLQRFLLHKKNISGLQERGLAN